MKKILKITAFILALMLILGVCAFANSLVGNPFSKALAVRTAEKHLAENYTNTDFVIDSVIFSFKYGYYHAFISSPGSMDSSFTLSISPTGKLLGDSYESRVLARWNTADRISREYRNAVDAVFESTSFPFRTHISFGDLEMYPREHTELYTVPDYAIITDDLTLDAFYDLHELGAAAGVLTVYIEDGTVTVERMAEILLCIRQIFDDAGIAFRAIDCVLEYPKPKDGARPAGRVEVLAFQYNDIREEGMTDRVQEANDAAIAYYREQDNLKQQES